MRVWLDTDRIVARPGQTVTLEGFVENSLAYAVDVSYAVNSDPQLRWRVLGPQRVDAQTTGPFSVELELPRELQPTLTSVPVGVTVRSGQEDVEGRAGAVIDIANDRSACAAFTAGPTIWLHADGTVALTASIVNCGSLDLSVDVRTGRGENGTLDLDTPQITLLAGAGPVDVTAVIGQDGTHAIAVGDPLQVDVIADGEVLTSATVSVRAAERSRRPRLLGLGVVAVVVAVALAVLGARLFGGQQPASDTAATPAAGGSTSDSSAPGQDPGGPGVYVGETGGVGIEVDLIDDAAGLAAEAEILREAVDAPAMRFVVARVDNQADAPASLDAVEVADDGGRTLVLVPAADLVRDLRAEVDLYDTETFDQATRLLDIVEGRDPTVVPGEPTDLLLGAEGRLPSIVTVTAVGSFGRLPLRQR